MSTPMTPDQIKEFLGQRFTVQGRIFHANLLTAKAKKDKTRETFDVMVAWNRNSNPQAFAAIAQFLVQASQMVHPGANLASPMFMNPIKSFAPLSIHGLQINEYFKQNGTPNAEYLRDCVWVNAGTGFAPVVCKPMGPQFPGQFINLTPADEAEVYGGRNAVVQISFYAQIPKPGDTNQRRGFGVNFHAVMLQDGGERVGGGDGASNVDVAQVFGAFAGDMGMGQAPAQNYQQPMQQAPVQNYAPQQAPQQNYQQPMQQNYAPQQAPAQGLPPLPNQNHGQQQGHNPFANAPGFAQSGPTQNNQQQQQYAQPNNFPPARGY